mgnify:FL=1
MTSKVTVQEVGRFEKLKFKTYLEIKKFNSKLLEKLEERGMDKYSFPFVIVERYKWEQEKKYTQRQTTLSLT